MSDNALAKAGFDTGNYRTIARHMGPGAILPGIVYFLVAQAAPMLVALAAASIVPALDSILRVLRGRRPSPVGLVFLVITGVSIGLATWLDSPLFILGRGPVLTGVMGTAFAISTSIGRPLTKTLALHLSTECSESRRRLAHTWSRPRTIAVFRTLSLGWGALLLVSAAQQGAVVATVSPGTVMAIEPPITTAAVGFGVFLSILYVQRCQRTDPELRLLPSRAVSPG